MPDAPPIPKPATAPASQPATKPIANPTATYVAIQWKCARPMIGCRFDPTGRYAFATSEDRSIQRWEIATGKQIGFSGHDSWVKALAFSKDGQNLVSGGYDGRLIWWPATADVPKPIRSIDAHAGWIRDMATSPDGRWLLTGGNDNLVKLWNIADGAAVKTFSGHEANIWSVAFHPTLPFALSGDLRGKIIQWDLNTGAKVREFDAKPLWSYNGGQQVDFGGVRTIAFSPDGKRMAAGGLHKAENPLGAVHEPLVLIFDWDSAKLTQSLMYAKKGMCWRIIWHPDGFLLGGTGGSEGGWLVFWKPEQPAEFHKFQLTGLVRDMDIHPDGVQVLTSHHDSHARLSRMAAKA